MRKLKTAISFILVTILAMAAFSVNVSGEAETTDREFLLEWYNARFQDTADDSTFYCALYGMIGGADIYQIGTTHSAYLQVIVTKRYGNTIFNFPNSACYVIVYDNRVFTFDEAYKAGIIGNSLVYSFSSYRIKLEFVGDLDNDYLVTVSDVILLRADIMENKGYSERSDVDDDGQISVSDVVKLRGIIMDGVLSEF